MKQIWTRLYSTNSGKSKTVPTLVITSVVECRFIPTYTLSSQIVENKIDTVLGGFRVGVGVSIWS